MDLDWLRQERRFVDIEKAIQAYLKYHGKRAEPWMYLLLAVAFEVNGRSQASIQSALGWAGYLARKQDDPITLVEVADVLMIRDIFEVPLPNNLPPIRAGDLLDRANEKAPTQPEPIVLSVLLAEKMRDPERLGGAIERLYALGWPGVDEIWRQESRHKAEALAEELREEGRNDEAQKLLERLAKSEPRDLFIRLTWSGDAGLDLLVEEPLGAKVDPIKPRSVFGGAIVKSGRGKHPESVYTCPFGFDGDYQVSVEVLYNNPEDPARDILLEIFTHEGSPEEHREAQELSLPIREPIIAHLEGGRRRIALPYYAPPQPGAMLVPEGQEAPSQAPAQGAESPRVRPPDAADAARLLREAGSSSKSRGSDDLIRPDGPGDRP